MKIIHFLVWTACILLTGNVDAQSPDWLWAKGIGGTGNENTGYSMVLDSYDNIYSTGSFTGTVDFDPGPGIFNLTSTGGSDIFVSKTDASGNFEWAKAIVGSLAGFTYDVGLSISLDASGNIYTTGNFQSTVDFDPGPGVFNLNSSGNNDIFISKLDSSGNFIWAKKMGGTAIDAGTFLAVDQSGSGDVFITGSFYGTCDFDPDTSITFNLTSAGNNDIYIAKLDSSGQFQWAKRIGGSGMYDFARSIAIDYSGNVYTTGSFNGSIDFDPGAGVYFLNSGGNIGIFISKLDSDGNFVWAKRMSGNDSSYGNCIIVGSNAFPGIYITGLFAGTIDFNPDSAGVFNITADSVINADIFISKLDTSGNFVWAKSMGGSDTDNCYSIALDDSGNIYNTGYFRGISDFDPGAGIFNLTASGGFDIFVSKMDASGNFVWAKSMGGTGNEFSQALALGVANNVFIAGNFESPTISFGPTILTNTGTGTSKDAFIAKLDNILTGIENLEFDNGISVYPNPASSQFTLKFKSGFDSEYTLVILDIAGREIEKFENISTDSHFEFGSSFVSGVYLAEMSIGDDKKIFRLIKQQ